MHSEGKVAIKNTVVVDSAAVTWSGLGPDKRRVQL